MGGSKARNFASETVQVLVCARGYTYPKVSNQMHSEGLTAMTTAPYPCCTHCHLTAPHAHKHPCWVCENAAALAAFRERMGTG